MGNGTHALRHQEHVLFPTDMGIDLKRPAVKEKKGFFRKYGKWLALSSLVPIGLGVASYLGSKKDSGYKMTGEELNAAVNQPGITLTTKEIEKRESPNKIIPVKSIAGANIDTPATLSGIKIMDMSTPNYTPTADATQKVNADYATLQNALKEFIGAYNSGDHKKIRDMSSFIASLKFIDRYDGIKMNVQGAIWRTAYRDIFRDNNDKMRPQDFEEMMGMLNDRFDDAVKYARKNDAIPGTLKLSRIGVYNGPEGINDILGKMCVDGGGLWEKYDKSLTGAYNLTFENGQGKICGNIVLGKTAEGKFVYMFHDFF